MANQHENDEYYSANESVYGDEETDEGSEDEYISAEDSMPEEDDCIMCRVGAHEDGLGELIGGVCGCIGKGNVYHFKCLVDRIKGFRDQPCHCGQQFTHPRIRRQDLSFWQIVCRYFDILHIILIIGLFLFCWFLFQNVFYSVRKHRANDNYSITIVVSAFIIFFGYRVLSMFDLDFLFDNDEYCVVFTHIKPDGRFYEESFIPGRRRQGN